MPLLISPDAVFTDGKVIEDEGMFETKEDQKEGKERGIST
jgi:hypothetical protein